MKEAMLYTSLPDEHVRCHLCAHRCIIAPNGRGVCQVRENHHGILSTLVYGELIAHHVDPIEKKPLFHYHPGSHSYSIATAGCNFRCEWCQNFDISQMPRDQHVILGESTSPEEIVDAARRSRCASIAYTYTEPTVFFEMTYDIAQLAQATGIGNVYVTNGYMTEQMLEMFHPYLDAANVDLKAFRDATYRRHIGTRLQPVLDSLKLMKRLGIWVEVTTLIIPDLNDELDELKDAARFIADELGPGTPWHLSRFFPTYRMHTHSPTPESTVERAIEIAREAGLHYVYAGNSRQNADTVCPVCGARLIQRSGYTIVRNRITAEGQCPDCHTSVAGIGMSG